MLCEICRKREATVHLSSCTPGEAVVRHRDFCESCVPFGSMSDEEQADALRKLLEIPPDVPIVGPGESDEPR